MVSGGCLGLYEFQFDWRKHFAQAPQYTLWMAHEVSNWLDIAGREPGLRRSWPAMYRRTPVFVAIRSWRIQSHYQAAFRVTGKWRSRVMFRAPVTVLRAGSLKRRESAVQLEAQPREHPSKSADLS